MKTKKPNTDISGVTVTKIPTVNENESINNKYRSLGGWIKKTNENYKNTIFNVRKKRVNKLIKKLDE